MGTGPSRGSRSATGFSVRRTPFERARRHAGGARCYEPGPVSETPIDEGPPRRGGLASVVPGRATRGATGWAALEPVLLAAWTCVVTGFVAGIFRESMLVQTAGEYSAPLDDVFIHFDYARAAARGFPLQWSEGNGISSGNTSLLYPFVLAPGWAVGLRDGTLMQWALIVAFVSVVAFLWFSSRLVAPLGRFAKYLVAPVVLSLGALNWSLWSGMENALHLGLWGVVLAIVLRAERQLEDRSALARSATLAGLAGILLLFTRPESATSLAVFGLWLGHLARVRHGVRCGVATVARLGAPGALALVAQTVLNRVATGEWSQAGAVAKLALNHPFMSATDKWNDWVFHLTYVLARNVQHHFADAIPFGYVVPALALVPLFDARVRRYAVLLWASVVGWVLVVALNGQVRWQNERYTMAAVAWLLLLAAMGLGVLLASPTRSGVRARVWQTVRTSVAGLAALLYVVHQVPNFRDQVWFFGRACRNIRDQHILAGKLLRRMDPKRVLVGDAGALLYFADVPGLDIIGLGGYRDLPFARAGRHGLGASIELIERMPADDRPDVMAIYPSWWGDLPLLFGDYVTEVPVVGNVICGGASKVIYRATWSSLENHALPRTMREGERVVAELDVADLVNERASSYVYPGPGRGYVVHRVLPDPRKPTRDLFDAGRIVPPGAVERATLTLPTSGGRLIVRTTATSTARVVKVRVAGEPRDDLHLPIGEGWVEASIDLPAGLPPRGTVELEAVDHEWIDHHVWVLSPP